MIEYLHDTIRAAAGDAIAISAKITDSAGAIIQDTCTLCLYDGNNKLLDIEGTLEENIWTFTINADTTAALAGRYWYKVCDCNHNSLDFAQPIYFITRGKGSDKFEAGKQFAEAAVKPELKAAIEERGAAIPEDAALSTYANYLRSCPNVAIGSFTPEEDTDELEIRGLNFKPSAIIVFYPHKTYEDFGDKWQIVLLEMFKDNYSFLKIIKGVNKYSNLAIPEIWQGEYLNFYDDGVSYHVDNYNAYFRAGYTYTYVII